jgi:hypothetical protein
MDSASDRALHQHRHEDGEYRRIEETGQITGGTGSGGVEMKVELRSLNSWLLGCVLLLVLLYFGRPLLMPLAFSLLLWGVLNALDR